MAKLIKRGDEARKALEAGVGNWTYLQENMIFEKDLAGKVRF